MDNDNRSNRDREEIAGLLMGEVVLPELQKCNQKKLPKEFKYLTHIAAAVNKVLPALSEDSEAEDVRKRGEYYWPFAQMALEEFEQQQESLPSKLQERIRTVREVIALLSPYFGLKGAVDGKSSGTDKRNARQLSAARCTDVAVQAKFSFKRTIQEIVSRHGRKFDFHNLKSMRDVPEEIKEELRFLPFANLSESGRKGMEELMDNQLIRQMAAVALSQELLQINYEKATSFYAYVTPTFRNRKNSSWERFQDKTAF